jgi:integrase
MVDLAPPGEPRHQRMKGGFATKAVAVAAMRAAVRSAKANGAPIRVSRLTVATYLQTWLASLTTGGAIRPTTWKTYDVAIRVHILPRIGGVLLKELTRIQVRSLYQQLDAGGRSRGATGGLSPKSVHNVHLCLHRALSEAVEDGLIRVNPASRAHRAPPDGPEMLYWSVAELNRFLASAASDPNLPFWRLAASTGMRRGELLGLRWRDVDLQQGRLSVRHQLVRTGGENHFGPPKTRAGRRSISLDPQTTAILRNIQDSQATTRSTLGTAYRHDLDLVFCRDDGSPHDPNRVAHQFAAQIARAGVRRIRFHDLRHTHATIAMAAGVHPKVMQERLGHTSIKVTLDLYSHVVPSMDEEAATRVAALVDGWHPPPRLTLIEGLAGSLVP